MLVLDQAMLRAKAGDTSLSLEANRRTFVRTPPRFQR